MSGVSRDPSKVDHLGKPYCFCDYSDQDAKCVDLCPEEISEKCEDDTNRERLRVPYDISNNGKPSCYGKHFSEYSNLCAKDCDHTYGCSEEKDKVKSPFERPPIVSPYKPLPVIVERPISKLADPYSTSYRPTVTSTSVINKPQEFYSNIPPPTQPPKLTPEEYDKYYGRRLHPNPIIEGQFEGEEWYSRLGKEFLKRVGHYAIQIWGQLLTESISNVRWAPK